MVKFVESKWKWVKQTRCKDFEPGKVNEYLDVKYCTRRNECLSYDSKRCLSMHKKVKS